jgi:hypothetical protein
MVAVNCEQVWQQVSDYIDGEVDPTLHAALHDHIGQCQRCTAVLEGTRNIVQLYSDERLFKVPLGYSWRLQRTIRASMPGRRGNVWGWAMATAAIALMAFSISIANHRDTSPKMRTAHAEPGRDVPKNLAVIVTTHGKLFHLAICPFLNQKDTKESLTAGEAEARGFVPCPRCLGEYVTQIARNFVKKIMGQTAA